MPYVHTVIMPVCENVNTVSYLKVLCSLGLYAGSGSRVPIETPKLYFLTNKSFKTPFFSMAEVD